MPRSEEESKKEIAALESGFHEAMSAGDAKALATEVDARIAAVILSDMPELGTLGRKAAASLAGAAAQGAFTLLSSRFVEGLGKTYKSGLVALDHIDLEVKRGEILARLSPDGEEVAAREEARGKE